MGDAGMEKKLSNLTRIFEPSRVAVIGASGNPSKLGYHVMKSLVTGNFQGEVVPVNARRAEVFGRPSRTSLMEVRDPVDLVVVVVPAERVPGVFQMCAQKGVGGIVLITAGFREIEDPKGSRLHEEILEIAETAGIPVIGPNTFGVVDYNHHLNATFTPEFSLGPAGGIACVSQSGGMAHLLSFLAMQNNVGFSKIVGLGNRLNIDFPEMISFLEEDEKTSVLMLYVEGVDKPRKMMSVLRRVAARKRIVAYKTGRSQKGDRASLSHTGSMAGDHAVYAGAFRQAGVVTVESAEELLDTAKAMEKCPLPRGPRVAVLSAQAGPGIAATDVCGEGGLELAVFDRKTQARINDSLPPLALRTNPVDMGPAWYDSEALSRLIRAVMEDPNVDAVLLLTLFASANVEIVGGMRDVLMDWNQKKPVVGSFLAPEGIWDAQIRDLEGKGAIANYPSPERAARALVNLWKSFKLLSFR